MSKDAPGHWTDAGTRKYQANGPQSWSKTFRRVAGKDGREGEGIRAALCYAVEHSEAFATWAESHPTAWMPATTRAPAKVAKAKVAKAKVAKAKVAPAAGFAISPKAKVAKAKVAKVAKAKVAKVAKVAKADQLEVPGTEAK